MLPLTPVNYEHVLELRRQQLALHEQGRSLQYERLLADLEASIADWQHCRERHPGPGTMKLLRAQAKWLAPVFATVANPLLLASPWFYGAVMAANGTGPDLATLYDRWAVQIALRGILKDRGVKRRG